MPIQRNNRHRLCRTTGERKLMRLMQCLKSLKAFVFFQEFSSEKKAGENEVDDFTDKLLNRNRQSHFFMAASTLSGVHGPTLDVC